ncbi:hypothetical protein, partial [Paramuribaculum intestinale]|uniref:hypothetical protein n=1 Tax=Paramuribaculum intestinale TaxID=2094151 RepID=UPI0026314DC0
FNASYTVIQHFFVILQLLRHSTATPERQTKAFCPRLRRSGVLYLYVVGKLQIKPGAFSMPPRC